MASASASPAPGSAASSSLLERGRDDSLGEASAIAAEVLEGDLQVHSLQLEPDGPGAAASSARGFRARCAQRRRDLGSIGKVGVLAFLINFKPSEVSPPGYASSGGASTDRLSHQQAFLAPYLIEQKGLTEKELDTAVWPVFTYSSLLLLLPVGILAEVVGYRATIFCGLVFREATRLLLLFGEDLGAMAAMQFTYAAGASAVETVLFAFVFTTLHDQRNFQFATCIVLTLYHGGNLLGSLLGQALVDRLLGDDLRPLFYISWAATTAGCVWFAFLPPGRSAQPTAVLRRLGERGGARWAWGELRALYGASEVRKWSAWWATGYGAGVLLLNYYQTQMYLVSPATKFGLLEAAIEAAALLGALAPLAGPLHLLKPAERALLPSGLAFVTSVAVILACWGGVGIAVSFACNVAAIAAFTFQYCIAQASIAAALDSERVALVFAANSFAALALLAAVQAAVGAAAPDRLLTFAMYAAALALQAAVLLPAAASVASAAFCRGKRAAPVA